MIVDVTVVIPTTGLRPVFLRRAVDSVLAQTTLPRELVVVVDGGDEETEQVRTELTNGRNGHAPLLRVVRTPDGPRGASAARNTGAHHARCDCLAFLDDDDRWKPAYLAAAFEDSAFDVCLTAFEKHREGSAAPEKSPPLALSAEAFFVANPGLRGSNLLIRRDLFLGLGGFDESLPAFNDLDFGIRLAEVGPSVYRRITDPLVEFWVHEGTASPRPAPGPTERAWPATC